MKTRILATLISLFTAFTLSSCLGSIDTGNINNNGGGNGGDTTPKLYELTVNNTTWNIYPSKVILTDNAKNDPENYTSDYTLTIIAVDASNMVNQDSKRLEIDFNADDIAELKDANIAEQEGFKISYRSAKVNLIPGGVATAPATRLLLRCRGTTQGLECVFVVEIHNQRT